MPYAIVKTDEGKIQAVPDTWVQGTSTNCLYLLWPSAIRNSPIEKYLVRAQHHEPPSQFEIKRCTVLQTGFSTFEDAIQSTNQLAKQLYEDSSSGICS